jgi:hypothetical protein
VRDIIREMSRVTETVITTQERTSPIDQPTWHTQKEMVCLERKGTRSRGLGVSGDAI